MSSFDMRPGLGPIHMRIIRLVADGVRHPKQISKSLTEFGGEGNLLLILGGLIKRGYLNQHRGHVYSLTNKAYDVLPRPEPAWWATTNYVPPKAPPRRPGSDHSYLPSVAADKFYDYIKHV